MRLEAIEAASLLNPSLRDEYRRRREDTPFCLHAFRVHAPGNSHPVEVLDTPAGYLVALTPLALPLGYVRAPSAVQAVWDVLNPSR